jgi:hypothetical protein
MAGQRKATAKPGFVDFVQRKLGLKTREEAQRMIEEGGYGIQ